ncbi:MAG: di-heme oxidoredictase family protein, partial [Myxococcota bacterium]
MLRLVCSWLLLGSAVVLPVGCTGCDADHGPIAEGVSGPLGSVVPYANEEQRAAFERGHEVIEKRFRRDEGLGPAFNVTFCGACHEKPTFGGSAGLYRNFLLSGVRTDDGVFVPGESFGRAGGVIRVYYYGDDERPRPVIPAATNVIAQRNAIPFFGVGLLAEIEEEEILRRSDPDDRDGDGISGRPNYDQGFVGRFGLKAQTVSIEGFIRGPLMNHLGITTDPLSEEQKARLPVDSSSRGVRTADARLLEAILPFAQAAAPAAPLTDDDGVADPEMSPQQLFDLVSFTMLLAAPELDPLDDKKRRGLRTFDEIGCKACHTPRLESPRGPLPVYSDLLLHDMGAALADGIEQGEATGSEFRTQPLWGLSAVGPYLHDGRAHTIDEAIDFHGGEAQGAR